MRCACVLLVLGVRCAIALLHTFLNIMTRFPVSEHYFSNLAHPFLFSNILFLFLNILFCFRTAYSDLEHPKICSNHIELQKLHVKVQFFFERYMKEVRVRVRVRSLKIEVRCESACGSVIEVRVCVRHTAKFLATQRLLFFMEGSLKFDRTIVCFGSSNL